MIHRFLLAACFCAFLLPYSAFCEAVVVDESENFALLEEQQAVYEPPVAHDDDNSYGNVVRKVQPTFSNEVPLAKDDSQTHRGNSNADLLNKVQGLQQEIQELRGQLEIQAHELALLKEQELSFYKDLDARLRGASVKGVANEPATEPSMPANPPVSQTNIPAHPTTTPGTSVTAATPPIINAGRVNPAEEQISYLAAYELVENKQFDDALLAMNTFITKYPHGGYSANAQYWLGELYLLKNDRSQAIEHFNVVLQEFPSSSKCAASLLKIGYAQAASGKTAEARATLQDVIKKYPDTSTAKLASTKLNSLKNY